MRMENSVIVSRVYQGVDLIESCTSRPLAMALRLEEQSGRRGTWLGSLLGLAARTRGKDCRASAGVHMDEETC